MVSKLYCTCDAKKYLLKIGFTFSFGLLLQYIPHILAGNYHLPVQKLKELFSFSPPDFYGLYNYIKKKI